MIFGRLPVRFRSVAVCVAAAIALVGCTQPTTPGGSTFTPVPQSVAEALAELQTEVVADGLTHPWDVAMLPDGSLLVTERGGRLVRIVDGEIAEASADFDDLFATGETGLMGLVLDPGFTKNSRFYTCQGNAPAHDIEVIGWTLSQDRSRAERDDLAVVEGLELSSGRHGGCRLAFDTTGALLVSAGDAAVGTNPQDMAALGGKVLRVDVDSFTAPEDNPFASSQDNNTRLVYTLGHRNVQGLAVQPDTGKVFVTEHGPEVDDEINVLSAGGNYGWDPVGAGDYDESVPMTDPEIPDAIEAVWSSGSETLAVSGATFLAGDQWGPLDGMLAVATLKGSHVQVFEVSDDATITSAGRPAALDDFGRLRTVVQGHDGAAYVLTDNGGGTDRIVKVTLP